MVRSPLTPIAFLCLSSLSLVFGGCQRGISDPSSPGTHTALDPQTPLEVGGFWSDGTLATAPFVRFQLSLANDQATLVPARLGQGIIGQHFNADITQALAGGFCGDCFAVESVRRDGGDLLVAMRVRHPFALADDAQGPSATNRRDLWISNVKGIWLTEGNDAFFAGTIEVDPATVRNPDGYTTILANSALGFEAYPYRVFGAENGNETAGNFDPTTGWSAHLDDPAGFNVLANDQVGRTTYRVHLEPGQTLAVDIVLTAAFSVAAVNRNDRLTPQYFLPAGASPEPWRVTASVTGELIAGDSGSSAQLDITALDWQQDSAYAVDVAYPNPANPNGLAVSSRIAAMEYCLPGIAGAPSTPIDLAGATGSGTSADPYAVSVPLPNEAAADAGIYWGLVKVIDERDPQAVGTPFVSTTFLRPDLETPYTHVTQFATYALFAATVAADPGGCSAIQEVRQSPSGFWGSVEANYLWCRSQTELDAALVSIEGTPGPMPNVDFGTHSVVVAASGRTPQGHGQRFVTVASACEDETASAITVTLLRGDPMGTCALTDIPTSPYVVSLVESVAPVATFVEDRYDTCTGNDCQPLDWYVVADGDAAAEGFGDPTPVFVLCANDKCYEEYALPLLGTQPLPPIDFQRYSAMIISTGYTDHGFPMRDVEMLSICRDSATLNYLATYRESEYLRCQPPPESEASAPFVIAAVEQPATGWNWIADSVDVCPVSFCDDALPHQVLAQGDVRDQVAGLGRFARYQDYKQFTTAWLEYFPTLAVPTVDFELDDVYLIALDQLNDSGNRRIEVTEVCYDAGSDRVTVEWSHWKRMTGACGPIDGQASRPVAFITAPRRSDGSSFAFDESPVDICNMPDCSLSLPTVLESGDAAGIWAGGPLDLAIADQELYELAWNATHTDGSAPPPVDFGEFFVTFTTQGLQPEGLGRYAIGMREGCVIDTRGTAIIEELVPQTCPPPTPPEPTAPYRFDRLARGIGPITGEHVWFAFDHEVLDTCGGSANCAPVDLHVITVGKYANESTQVQQHLVSDQTELEEAWEAFFLSPPMPVPVLDFANYDAILLSAGWTPDGGEGTRALWFTGLCSDPLAEYLRIDAQRTDWTFESCPFEEGKASCPWILALIPKGAADGWTVEIDYQVTIPDICEGAKWVLPATELAASFDSLWTSPAAHTEFFDDPDLPTRLQEYRDLWAFLGAGDPPGIDDIGQYEGILVMTDGLWQTNWGKHDMVLASQSVGWGFMMQFCETARMLPGELCGEDRPTAPYRIYKLPLIDLGWYTDTSGTIDPCQ